MTRRDVIVAIGTPPGKGALGVVRMSGRGSLEAARRFIDLPETLLPRRAALVRVRDRGGTLDRTLTTFFASEASYTGEEMVEISAHGSPFILERLLQLAQEAGARLALPGEFTQRAFLHGRIDLLQAEAVCDLIESETQAAQQAAVEQIEGGLSDRIRRLRSGLLDLTAHVEAELDHPDEDIPLLTDRDAISRIDLLNADVTKLADTHQRGRLVRQGPRIAIIGKTNAGKSTLFNALLGRDRSITARQPGTTRDTIEERAEIGGMPAVLVDTAGLRDETSDPVEREGMRRTRSEIARADLALWVLDRTDAVKSAPAILQEVRHSGRASIAVLNKSDRGPARLRKEDLQEECPTVEVSALKGIGLDELLRQIQESLLPRETDEERPILLTSVRHYHALQETQKELQAARASVSLGFELAAAHLRGALTSLDAILGLHADEEVLDSIFSRFCIGK